MKILFAAVAFIFMAAAADARHTAPDYPIIHPVTEITDNGLENNFLSPGTVPNDNPDERTVAGSRKSLFKNLKAKMTQQKPGAVADDVPQQGQNPAQNPANRETSVDQAKNPQEVKAIPKARRVERPAKVEGGSAKRPSVGSAKRGGNASAARPNAASAKPDQTTKPNQVNRPARASRPTGGGRPDHAGKPNKGKGKD